MASPICSKALNQRNRHATTKGCAYSVNAITLNTTKPQKYKSVTSCIAIQFNESRNHFSQMSDIFLALGGNNSQPESFDPLHQLCLIFWLHLPSDELSVHAKEMEVGRVAGKPSSHHQPR